MLPVIALVGRPNVGKSTLFNCLTRTRDALVADQPGLTRDRQYGVGKVGLRPYVVLDTGGLSGIQGEIDDMIATQVWKAIEEADVILFLVDGRAGVNSYDIEIAKKLRKVGKKVVLTVNKAEDRDEDIFLSDFFSLGFGVPMAIAAEHQRGLFELMQAVFSNLPEYISPDEPEGEEEERPDRPIRLAIIGRPNVGKSTLINRILGEERVLACDMPGTTRDSIEIPFTKNGRDFILIDTAGVRRRTKIDDKVEIFSVLKSLQALEQSNVVIFVFDAHEGISDQDAHLIGHALDSGRALVLVVNKWDGMAADDKDWIKSELLHKFTYIDFASPIFISALHGTNVPDVLNEAIKAFDSSISKFTTNELSNILEAAVAKHQPPVVRGLAPKLRYAHQGGKNPPRIIIHGNRVDHVHDSYKRYLINVFRNSLHITGTPVRLEFRSGDNPYKDKALVKPKDKTNPNRPRKPNRQIKQKQKSRSDAGIRDDAAD